ncbi:MAG: DUF2628 domain-containing protein [Alphaproteobacteria bacterium]|nr:DUF2628 domain-containing protein [Alphaproteobacteria bacterium]
MGARVYTVHLNPLSNRPERDAIFVREGFNWAAAFFGIFWALRHRLWWPAAGMLAYLLALAAAETYLPLDPVRVAIFDTAFAILVGFEANDLRRLGLAARGFVEEGLTVGRNLDDAELRWYASYR